ncbi:unnamed protein product [Plutella xylostella]|uniref:(diamondback moth) hypothetical protein n=1 Tax=Plutella xylostella TaxID=51655 RepID=A0A8S4GA20_PLUXY|nr:unnamed protein product [Plutella xylostella]
MSGRTHTCARADMLTVAYLYSDPGASPGRHGTSPTRHGTSPTRHGTSPTRRGTTPPRDDMGEDRELHVDVANDAEEHSDRVEPADEGHTQLETDECRDPQIDVGTEEYEVSARPPTPGHARPPEDPAGDLAESWHPHVYGKPPVRPTPHTIDYILGLSDDRTPSDSNSVSQLVNVKRNLEVCVRRNSAPKNKLQEQLLQRTARASTGASTGASAGASRGEEPLNLTLPKSRSVSTWVDDEKLYGKEALRLKRKKSTESLVSPSPEGSVSSSEGEAGAGGDAGGGRRKKARTTFTGRQIFELEKLFEVKKYLSSGERADMAKLLNVTETQQAMSLTD